MKAPVLELEADQPANEAAADVLRALYEAMEENLPGSIDGVDPECLHDFRVAVRRTRAVQRQLRSAFPHTLLKHFRREFRWLQGATGDARDLDVYVLGFDVLRDLVSARSRPALEPVLDVLAHRRERAREELTTTLCSGRTAAVLTGWEKWLGELGDHDSAQPIGKLAAKRIRKLYRQVVRKGSDIGSRSPSEDYHELRKKGKELRYMLELFGLALYPPENVRPLIKTLKSLQDVLGRHQDRVVQATTVSELRAEVSEMHDSAPACAALDELVERLMEDERAARGSFSAPFDALRSPSQRRRVKVTFR